MSMAENGGLEGDHLAVTEGTSFSQLLFAADEVVGLAVNSDQTFNYTHSSAFPTQIKSPKMLCFGNYDHAHGDRLEIGFSGATCSDSSSASSIGNTTVSALSNSIKKRNGLCQESAQSMSKTTISSQRGSKKTKSENPTNRKRKEKLGERIAALQHLVSPFGKTDTASVLHEAMGYIRFLHDQVQVLCSPYLQRHPSLPLPGGVGEVKEEEAWMDLRSRGLYLVPVEYTVHVANSNGADFWSPAMANINNNINNHV